MTESGYWSKVKFSSSVKIAFKALRDNRVNDREFKLMLVEVDAYKS